MQANRANKIEKENKLHNRIVRQFWLSVIETTLTHLFELNDNELISLCENTRNISDQPHQRWSERVPKKCIKVVKLYQIDINQSHIN